MRSLIEQSVPPAELFVIEPVMSAVVKMAAEDLPAGATFLTDDLPTPAGMLSSPIRFRFPTVLTTTQLSTSTRSSGSLSLAASCSSAGRKRSTPTA